VKFFFPINLKRIVEAAEKLRKSYFTETLWKYVHACARKVSREHFGDAARIG
jgi:hypothetical protein